MAGRMLSRVFPEPWILETGQPQRRHRPLDCHPRPDHCDSESKAEEHLCPEVRLLEYPKATINPCPIGAPIQMPACIVKPQRDFTTCSSIGRKAVVQASPGPLTLAPSRYSPAGMIALGMICLTGFLLISCEKPEPRNGRPDTTDAPTRSTRSGSASRQPVQGSMAELRKILKTAADIDSPEAREKAIADVAWNALETDPELACQAFLQLPTGSPEKIRLIQHYAMRLAEQNTDEALAWAGTLESEQEISAAHSQIALTLAEIDPQRAASLLSESGIVSREFDVAVVQVIQRWAAQSAPETAAWVTMFPPGPAREAGIKIIADRWLHADAAAAFSWLATLQDADVRKEAALGMEEAILQQPGDIRDTWLHHADASIRSELEQQREQAIEEVGDNIPPP